VAIRPAQARQKPTVHQLADPGATNAEDSSHLCGGDPVGRVIPPCTTQATAVRLPVLGGKLFNLVTVKLAVPAWRCRFELAGRDERAYAGHRAAEDVGASG